MATFSIVYIIVLMEFSSGLPRQNNLENDCGIGERKVPFSQCDVDPRSSESNVTLRNENGDDDVDEVCCLESKIIEEKVKKSCSQVQGFRCVISERCSAPRTVNVEIQTEVPICDNIGEICCDEKIIVEEINPKQASQMKPTIGLPNDCAADERKVPLSQCNVEPTEAFEFTPRQEDESDDVCCPESKIINLKKSCQEFQGFRCVASERCLDPRSIGLEDKPFCMNPGETCCDEKIIAQDNEPYTQVKPEGNPMMDHTFGNFQFDTYYQQSMPFFSADECPQKCPQIYQPVCGSNGVLYTNICVFQIANCAYNFRLTISSDKHCSYHDYIDIIP